MVNIRSILWHSIHRYKLTINMRIYLNSNHDSDQSQEFSEFLLRIGEGTEPTYRYLNIHFNIKFNNNHLKLMY